MCRSAGVLESLRRLVGNGVGRHRFSGSLCWFRGRRVKHLDLRLSLSSLDLVVMELLEALAA